MHDLHALRLQLMLPLLPSALLLLPLLPSALLLLLPLLLTMAMSSSRSFLSRMLCMPPPMSVVWRSWKVPPPNPLCMHDNTGEARDCVRSCT
jgi:hypothetical protein